MTPTLAQIATHFDAYGGLWRIIPANPMAPWFAVLGITQGPLGPMRTYNGGDMIATIDDNAVLQGAEWVPVDRKGDRIE